MDKKRTPYKLLELLSDGRFHSGEQLAKEFNITRSGIWKSVRQLETLGIEVHAVSGKGYRIPNRIELLNQSLIESSIASATASSLDELLVLLSTSSTNDYLLDLLKERPGKRIVCLAEHQSRGRGRHGRSWISGFASSAYMSLLWHFDRDPGDMMGLSLAIGVGLVNALTRYGISSGIQLKWPNDVLWNGRKLAGILIEMLAEPYGVCSVVIGIGLNMQIPAVIGDQITQPWVDIAGITGDSPQRNRLIALMMDEIIASVKRFSEYGLADFITDWKQYDAMIGKLVSLTTVRDKIQGVLQDISRQGELVIRTADNNVQRFVHGEVSLREIAA